MNQINKTMNHLNKVILFLLVNCFLLLIVGFFVRNDFDVEREIIIPKSEAHVFRYIKYLKNQEHFSVWIINDSNVKKVYRGIDGRPGFFVIWDNQNNKFGRVRQKLLRIIENEKILTKLHFDAPFQMDAKADFMTESVSENATKVKWKIHGNMSYPRNLALLFVDINMMLGTPLEASLKNLKSRLR